jgi:hypothetical protein
VIKNLQPETCASVDKVVTGEDFIFQYYSTNVLYLPSSTFFCYQLHKGKSRGNIPESIALSAVGEHWI